MNRIYTLIIAFFCFINIAKADNWLTSFKEAQKIALATDKLILVDFWATWCGPCKKMDAESWSKKEVQVLMDNYVSVKIDIDQNRSLAQKYNIKGIPFIFIMDGNGKVLYKQMSYKPKSEVIKLLNKYAISTLFLKQHLINYYSNPNFAASFRVASKYSDFSVFLNKSVRKDFLNLSNKYFNTSEKLLKKSDLKNKKRFIQKIELFKIQGRLILNNPKKGLKMLSKINESDLEKVNKAFFHRLNYITFMQMNEVEKALIWNEKLNDSDRKKVTLFLKSV